MNCIDLVVEKTLSRRHHVQRGKRIKVCSIIGQKLTLTMRLAKQNRHVNTLKKRSRLHVNAPGYDNREKQTTKAIPLQ